MSVSRRVVEAWGRAWGARRAKLGVITGVIFLLAPASASALSGTPIQVGAANGNAISEVVDSSGQAYIAWLSGTGGPGGGTPQTVNWCVIDPGQGSCGQSGTLSPSGMPDVGQPMLTIVGSTVVLVSEDFIGGSSDDANYVNEWTAPAGQTSTSWTAIDGGDSVAQDNGYSADQVFPIPASGTPTAIGFGFGGVGFGSQEQVSIISPFTAPPECSETVMDANMGTCPSTPLATLNPSSETFSAQGVTASYAPILSGSDEGVLGAFTDPISACPAGSPANAGTSFIYAGGASSSTNDYGLSPGTADSAWHAMTNLECTDANPSATGGPAGYGVLETNESLNSMNYYPFNIAAGTFGTPVTIAGENGDETSISQDGSGGVYAAWVDGNSVYSGAFRLAYSANGGQSWTGPATINDLTYPLLSPTTAVGSDGQGWAVWLKGLGGGDYAVEAQQFDAADAVPPATSVSTTQTSGSSVGADISVPVGTTGETDQATISGVNAATAGGSVTYTLYSSATCSASSEVFGGGKSTVTNGVASPSSEVDSALGAGAYYWQASYSGDLFDAPSTSTCGSEVLTVGASSTRAATAITTKQASGSATGASISISAGTVGETDQATILGADANTAGGTVTYTLYASNTCDPGTSLVFNGGAKPVSDGVAQASLPVTQALSPGTYYWQAIYSGDAKNAPVTSTCGAEVLTVIGPAIGGSGTATGSTVTIPITCPSACTLSLTLTVPGAGGASVATAARGKTGSKTIKLGSGKFRLPAHKRKLLTIHLNKAGKKLARSKHDRFTAKLTVSVSASGHTVTTSKTIKFKPKKK